MTAAHCVWYNNGGKRFNPDQIFVTAGHRANSYKRAKNEDGKTFKKAKVMAILEHKDYQPTLYTDDIALLKLERTLVGYASHPACLPSPLFNLDSKIDSDKPPVCIISGWGTRTSSGRESRLLHHLPIPIKKNEGNNLIVLNKFR